MGRLGFALPRRPLSELEPIALDAPTVLKLAVSYRSEAFYQLHGFLSKLTELAPRPSAAIQDLPFTDVARARFEQDLAQRFASSQRAPKPIGDPRNGNNAEFLVRGCLDGVLDSTAGLYGDLQGIAGQAMQEIKSLDVPMIGVKGEAAE